MSLNSSGEALLFVVAWSVGEGSVVLEEGGGVCTVLEDKSEESPQRPHITYRCINPMSRCVCVCVCLNVYMSVYCVL